MLKDAVWLVKKEYQFQWRAIIGTFLGCLFIGLIIMFFLSDPSIGVRDHYQYFKKYMLDLFFIGLAPSFGTLFMAKPYLSYNSAKQNPYGKRMAVLRTLPIPVSVLSLSRILLMISTLLLMSIGVFGTIGILWIGIAPVKILTVSEFIIFYFVWLGFALAVGGISPYIEYGMKGKMLHIFPFMYMGIFLIVEFTLIYYNVSMIEGIFEIVKSIGWPIAILSLIIGGFSLVGWHKLLQKRILNRDYL